MSHSVLSGLLLVGLSGCTLITLSGCQSYTNDSIVGDSTANDVTQKPVSQVDTGAKKNITFTAGSEMDSTNSGRSSAPDVRFLENAYRGGLLEVELGGIAQKKAADPQVKDFGAMMVRDHSQGGEAILALASAERLTLPDSVSADQRHERDHLLNESNEDFDKDYINLMVLDHKNDITEFKAESIGGQDSTIKSFAVQTMKMLNTHLDRAEYLQSKMH